MPADIRALAQEAIELAGRATPGPWRTAYAPGDVRKPALAGWPAGVVICAVAPRQRVYSDHDGGSYPANDERLIAHAGTHYATLARALLEALDERDEARGSNILNRNAVRRLSAEKDAILADLPHALGTCGCSNTVTIGAAQVWSGWPEPHTAAAERVKARVV